MTTTMTTMLSVVAAQLWVSIETVRSLENKMTRLSVDGHKTKTTTDDVRNYVAS
jgi:hypothetical protein